LGKVIFKINNRTSDGADDDDGDDGSYISIHRIANSSVHQLMIVRNK
jgi:hypothetical protein